MPVDISLVGLRVRLIASFTYPTGVDLSEFGDDNDPFTVADWTIADGAMTLQGTLLTWSSANRIDFTLSVAPNTKDDNYLRQLLYANNSRRDKIVPADVITITGVYPQGNTVTLSGGRIISGPPTVVGSAAGRMVSSSYNFIFERANTSN